MEPYEPSSSTECGNLHNSSPQCPFTVVDNNSEVLDVNVSLLEEVIRSFNRYEVTCRGRNLLKEVIGLLSPSTGRKQPRSKSPLWRRSFGPSTGTRSQRSKPKGGQSIIESFNRFRGHSSLWQLWCHRGHNYLLCGGGPSALQRVCYYGGQQGPSIVLYVFPAFKILPWLSYFVPFPDRSNLHQ